MLHVGITTLGIPLQLRFARVIKKHASDNAKLTVEKPLLCDIMPLSVLIQ